MPKFKNCKEKAPVYVGDITFQPGEVKELSEKEILSLTSRGFLNGMVKDKIIKVYPKDGEDPEKVRKFIQDVVTQKEFSSVEGIAFDNQDLPVPKDVKEAQEGQKAKASEDEAQSLFDQELEEAKA